MKINIAASHRFHLLDLARELQDLGHDVRFYSYVPNKRVESFGLRKENSISLLWLVIPFFIVARLIGQKSWISKYQSLVMDGYMSFFSRKCDVYIALGTVYKHSFITAKKKGAITILEWGSKHIDDQQQILAQIGAPLNPEYFNKRSRDGYELADYIAIASNHVKQSFINRGLPEHKFLQNPYGVDLSMFYPTELAKENPYDLIMVGGWSLRKGCDLLVEVCQKYGYSLLHVGSIVDLEFPKASNMTHIDSVDQYQLVNYYSQAKVFVLPSREEGLAMVQAQALVCGLPIVCSKDSGGRDLMEFISDNKWIIEVNDLSIDSINNSIDLALTLVESQLGIRGNYDIEKIKQGMSWQAYGVRWSQILQTIQ